MRTRLRCLIPFIAITLACAPAAEKLTGDAGDAVDQAIRSGTESFDHTAWDTLLRQVTAGGRMDYPTLKERRSELETYLSQVSQVELATLESQELKALLINAYNAITALSILDHPGVTTIKAIPGVWDSARHTIGGFQLTLDEIEHNLLRPYFLDPRIHFAVNCASASCAPLPPEAYRGENLDRQLNEAAHRFLQDAGNVRFEGDTLLLSRYFDWYGQDFVSPEWTPHAQTVPEFVGLYSETVRRALQDGAIARVRFLDYDWSLNQVID